MESLLKRKGEKNDRTALDDEAAVFAAGPPGCVTAAAAAAAAVRPLYTVNGCAKASF